MLLFKQRRYTNEITSALRPLRHSTGCEKEGSELNPAREEVTWSRKNGGRILIYDSLNYLSALMINRPSN